MPEQDQTLDKDLSGSRQTDEVFSFHLQSQYVIHC